MIYLLNQLHYLLNLNLYLLIFELVLIVVEEVMREENDPKQLNYYYCSLLSLRFSEDGFFSDSY